MEVIFSNGARSLGIPLHEGRVNVSKVLREFGAGVLMWKDDGSLKKLEMGKSPGDELSTDIFTPGKTYQVIDAVTFAVAFGEDKYTFPLFDGRVRVREVLDACKADGLRVEDVVNVLREHGEFSFCRFRSMKYSVRLLERYRVERDEKEDKLTHAYVFASQGMRKVEGCDIEDTYAVAATPSVSLFGVFDGHNGSAASRFCAKHMFKYLTQNECFQRGEYAQSLKEVFLQMDRLMRSQAGLQEIQNLAKEPPVHDDAIVLTEEHGLGMQMVWPEDHPAYYVHASPGTCAVVALVLEKKVFIASAGDCRCSLYSNKKLIHLTTDHWPSTPEESARIRRAGGQVLQGRVAIESLLGDPGTLNMSRTIGDLHFKMNNTLPQEEQIVSAAPDIVEVDISKDCEFLIVNSDGVWRDYFDTRCEKISKAIKEDDKEAVEKAVGIDMEVLRNKPSRGRLLFERRDDVTVIVVSLKQAALHGADHLNINKYPAHFKKSEIGSDRK